MPRAFFHEPLNAHTLKIQTERKPSWIKGSGVTFNIGMKINFCEFDSATKPHNENKQTNKTSSLTSDYFVKSFHSRLLMLIILRLVSCKSTRSSLRLYEEIEEISASNNRHLVVEVIMKKNYFIVSYILLIF